MAPDPSIVQQFETQVAARPAAPAVRHGDVVLDYAQLAARVHRLATRLAAIGVGPGDLVAVALERSADLPAVLFAILKTGAGYVPIDPSHPAGRIAQVLEDAAPRLVLATHPLPPVAAAATTAPVLPLVALQHDEASDVALPEVDLDAIAYVIFTSGSTGRPKGVEIPHRALANFALAMAACPGLGPDDRVAAITTLSFDIAVLELLVPLAVGAQIDVLDRDVGADGARLRDHLVAHPPTLLQATPATWRMLVDAGWAGTPTARLLTGGEALPVDLARELLPRGAELWNMYGPTETTVWSTLYRVAGDEPGPTLPIGRAVRRTSVYVLDAAGQPVAPGAIGELVIGGDGVARGYRNRDELTRERFVPDPFAPGARIYRTGDLASFGEDGLLHYHGRADRQIKLRGHRIEPAEIETVLRAHADVADAVVLARDIDIGAATPDRRLVAYVVSRDAGLDDATLRARAAAALPEWMVPAHFVLLDQFPLTSSGKVDAGALPPPVIASAQEPTAEALPRDDVEVAVAVVYQQLLGLPHVGRDDDFFLLGGHSLLAVRAQAALRRTLSVDLPAGALFERRTPAALAAYVRELRATPGAAGARLAQVMPLQPRGEGPPLFFVCGIQIYHELAQAMGRPSCGVFLPVESEWLEAQQTGRERKPPSVPDMATAYLQVIRAHQPRGPYLLAGLSFGGVLAYEIAQRLRRSGEEVALLALFDTVLPRARKRSVGRWIATQVGAAVGGDPTAAKRLWDVVRRRTEQVVDRVKRRGAQAPVAAADPQRELSDDDLRVLRNGLYQQAIDEHDRHVQPYPGRVVFFRAADRVDSPGWLVDDAGGWRELARGGLDVVDIPGDHTGIVAGSSARLVARRLEEEIERTVSSPAARAAV